MKKKDFEKLVNAVNAKKAEVERLVSEDSLEAAKAAKEELVRMQNKLDIVKDMVMDDGPEPEDAPGVVSVGMVPAEPAKDAVHEFANAARARFKNMMAEGVNSDGGYTVPEDIQTMVQRYKEAKFSLETLVDVESVTTESGRRTFQKKSQHTGFSKVLEAGKIGAVATPTFEIMTYSVSKYAGYLPVTNELLDDSDANITNTIIEWLGEEDIATKNALILTKLKSKAATDLEDLDGIKKAVNVTLGSAYAGGIKIVTNDDGLNYLDTLKDRNGQYLLKTDQNPNATFTKTLAIGAEHIPVVVVPNAVVPSASKALPFFIGDLKEAIKLFDRRKMSIMVSNEAAIGGINAFEQDLTIFRAIERLDIQTKDADAFVYGTITVE